MYKKFLILAFTLFVLFSSNVWGEDELGEYIIGPSDILEIIVWREDNLSKEVTVRPDGRITLPLINDIVAAGKTPMQLRDEIEKRLKEYIDLPVVTVIVKGIESKYYYVIGEVANPGGYLLSKPLTVLQALALAGGFTEWAKKDKIMVIRSLLNGEKQILNFNYEMISKGHRINDFYLKSGDIIVVP